MPREAGSRDFPNDAGKNDVIDGGYRPHVLEATQGTPYGGSLAASAATINYSVQQNENEYIFNPVCYFKLDRVKVKIEGDRLLIIPDRKKNKNSPFVDGGCIVLPQKADRNAEPKIKIDYGLYVTVPKKQPDVAHTQAVKSYMAEAAQGCVG